MDGNLIAGFKRSDCDHHTFSAQLKFVDTHAYVNSSRSEKCTLSDPDTLRKMPKEIEVAPPHKTLNTYS